jgi:hypothetical protein
VEIRNFEPQQRGGLFESCPPKDSVEPSRGQMACHGMFETIW